jgi:chromosome segregation ATPase
MTDNVDTPTPTIQIDVADAEALKGLETKFIELATLRAENEKLKQDFESLKKERIRFKRNYEDEVGKVKEKNIEIASTKRELEITKEGLKSAQAELEESAQASKRARTLEESLTDATETISALHSDIKQLKKYEEYYNAVTQINIAKP